TRASDDHSCTQYKHAIDAVAQSIPGDRSFELAPAVGFEPTTNRLTADRSTTELRWNDVPRVGADKLLIQAMAASANRQRSLPESAYGFVEACAPASVRAGLFSAPFPRSPLRSAESFC